MSLSKNEFLRAMQDIIMLHNVVLDDKYLTSYSNVTITAESWQTGEDANYPKYCDIPVTGVTANHQANVFFIPADLEKANACGVSDFTETLPGKIRIRAVETPKNDLTAEICITTGKELENAGND